MATVLELVQDLNQMILEGKIMEAFEKHYAEEVVMEDDGLPATVGKDANREREQNFVNSLTAFRGAEVKNIWISGNIACVEWFMDYTHKEWGDVAYTQVAVQRWRDGKIVREVFFNNK
ncbi:MAG: nuclear transport factor 2 family protein [Bacteroidia bacterium]|jgi:hypothetical protein|nr:nuclear transport factor 2 family protein [Bacteroidia bacterium]